MTSFHCIQSIQSKLCTVQKVKIKYFQNVAYSLGP